MLALQTLYEESLSKHALQSILARYQQDKTASPEVVDFAARLVHGISANKEKIDGVIRSLAPMWPLEQVSIIDLSILRIAVFEILIDKEVPFKVSINEAIELAKSFGGESSARFVNGVLGSLVRGNESNTQ